MSESPSIDAAVAAAIQRGEVPEAEAPTPSEPAADTAQDTEDGLD